VSHVSTSIEKGGDYFWTDSNGLDMVLRNSSNIYALKYKDVLTYKFFPVASRIKVNDTDGNEF
jgi:hypothetical protein